MANPAARTFVQNKREMAPSAGNLAPGPPCAADFWLHRGFCYLPTLWGTETWGQDRGRGERVGGSAVGRGGCGCVGAQGERGQR